jgi:hypothetical protein
VPGVNLLVGGKITRAEELLETDDTGTLACSFTDTPNGLLEIRGKVGGYGSLYKRDADGVLLHHKATEKHSTEGREESACFFWKGASPLNRSRARRNCSVRVGFRNND